MLSLPSPGRMSLPACCNCSLDNRGLSQMALPRCFAIRSARQPGTTPYPMALSCPSSNLGCDYVDPTVPKLVTDSPPNFAIKVLSYLAVLTAVNRCAVLGDLFIALTCVRRS